MSGPVSYTCDYRSLQRALNVWIAEGSKGITKALNDFTFDVLKDAHRLTPVASVLEIGNYYNTLVPLRRKKKDGSPAGWFPRKYAIAQAHRKAAGERGLSGQALVKAGNKLETKARRARGSLRQGWIGALKVFAKNVGLTASGGPPVKAKGGGKPAKDGLTHEATAFYNLVTKRAGGEIDPRVVTALDQAFEINRKQIIAHLERNHAEAARKAGLI